MGSFPARRVTILDSSLSVQVTSCPISAKQAPVTKPTYPQPITEIRKIRISPAWIPLPTLAQNARRLPYAVLLVKQPCDEKSRGYDHSDSSELPWRSNLRGRVGANPQESSNEEQE